MAQKAASSKTGWVLFGIALLIGAVGVVLIARDEFWGRALVGVGGILILLAIFLYRRPGGQSSD